MKRINAPLILLNAALNNANTRKSSCRRPQETLRLPSR
jgi:hypothetical protein